jgi:hypothetical protein
MAERKKSPRYAPGMEDVDIIPLADEQDEREGNVTTETRVYLDENDPAHGKKQ